MRYGDYTYGVVVRAEAPWKTFKELVDYAKANPGKVRYSTSGAGTFHHLAMEALAKQEGIKWIHIPYKGGHEATTAILGGHVEVEACSSEWKPHVESGKLRLLATYNPSRLPRFPDVPSWVELGYRIAASGYIAILGPKGMPRPSWRSSTEPSDSPWKTRPSRNPWKHTTCPSSTATPKAWTKTSRNSEKNGGS